MPDRGCLTRTFVELGTRVLSSSLRARGSTRTLKFLVVTAATATAACSIDLGYLDDGPANRSDGSITDATMGGMADHTSGDGPANVADSAGQNDVNVPADSEPQGGSPALLPDAGTFPCPTTIEGAITSCDGTQIGRDSRVGNSTVCNATVQFPGTAADPNMPHYYHVYRFANTTTASSCYTFTLTYGGAGSSGSSGSSSGGDGGDASTDGDATVDLDASTQNDADAALDASPEDDAGASCSIDEDAAGMKYMSTYTTFYPDNLSEGFVGYTAGVLAPPQSVGITVAAGGTVDVVVTALDVAPTGTGPFTLTCTAQ